MERSGIAFKKLLLIKGVKLQRQKKRFFFFPANLGLVNHYLSSQFCKDQEVRDAPKKNSDLIWVFSIRGGGQSKSFRALFCAPTILEMLVKKGGCRPNPKSLSTFFLNFW